MDAWPAEKYTYTVIQLLVQKKPLPGLYLFFSRPTLQMASALFNASSAGDIDAVLRILNEDPAVDLQLGGEHRFSLVHGLWPVVFSLINLTVFL